MAIFRDLELAIPPGWQDATTITLLGPAPERVTLPHTKQPPAPLRPTWVLRRVPIDAEPPALAELASKQEQVLAEMGALEHLGQEDITLQLGEASVAAHVRELSLQTDGAPLRQLHVYFQLAGELYAVVGSASMDTGFAALRETFLTILKSLRRHA